MTDAAAPTQSTRPTRDDAWDLLCEWTQGDALRKHGRAVEGAVGWYAEHRFGKTGEELDTWRSAGLLHDSRGFLADWLGDLAVEQHEDGSVPVVIPQVLSAESAGIAGWSDAAVVVPWQVALRSGDRSVLEQALPSMRAWVDCVERNRKDGLWVDTIQPFLRLRGLLSKKP